jgi:hypothetical protein
VLGASGKRGMISFLIIKSPHWKIGSSSSRLKLNFISSGYPAPNMF